MAKKAKAKAASGTKKAESDDLIGKRVQFDRATFEAVDMLARDQMKDLAEITEEAFRDLLKKHGRSADLREALKLSARGAAKQRS
jgi:hypothetical protein